MNSEELYKYLDNRIDAKINAAINKLFLKDHEQGYECAKDDIKEWCTKKVEKIINDQRKNAHSSSWTYGYKSALIDVIEYIERM